MQNSRLLCALVSFSLKWQQCPREALDELNTYTNLILLVGREILCITSILWVINVQYLILFISLVEDVVSLSGTIITLYFTSLSYLSLTDINIATSQQICKNNLHTYLFHLFRQLSILLPILSTNIYWVRKSIVGDIKMHSTWFMSSRSLQSSREDGMRTLITSV